MPDLSRPGARGGLAMLGASLGVLALAASGTLAAPTRGATDARPMAASVGLTRFASCAQLRSWYVDAALREVGPYGWDGENLLPVHPMTGPTDELAPSGSAPGTDVRAPADGPAAAVGSSPTGTTIQERGVDEPDVAKTDGTVLVQVAGGSVLVSDVTGDQPRRLASYQLPGMMSAGELLLAGHRVVVISTTTSALPGVPPRHVPPLDDVRPTTPLPTLLAAPVTTSTRVLTLDLTDPASPRQVSDQTFSGSMVSARQYGDTVRLVTSDQRPSLQFARPGERGYEPGSATLRNRATVRASAVGDWLPTVRDSDQPASAARPLLRCTDVLHPPELAGAGTISVIGFDVARPTSLSTAALTADGDTVYSSTGELYVATDQSPSVLVRPQVGPVRGRVPVPATRTEIHQFDLAGDRASYVASGQVPGVVRDRWSMDAYDGQLRVALQTGSDRAFDDGARRDGGNAILTMSRHGDRLVETGRVGGLGNGEEIKSVRWFDDLAVLVTFRQMDPLFTVDLSDPGRPKAVGELRMPGFSGYLHPIGHHLLLGLGTDATSSGVARGALISVFDLTDPQHPTRTGSHTFAAQTYLAASEDPRGFTWTPGPGPEPGPESGPGSGPDSGIGTGFAQLMDWSGSSDFRLARIGVGPGGDLSTTVEQVTGVPVSDTSRVLPLRDGRVVLVAGGTARTMKP